MCNKYSFKNVDKLFPGIVVYNEELQEGNMIIPK